MAGDAKKLQPIIIKRIKKGGHAAHGGAWKIAYADFVTAMMAFFLLMWLLGSTTDGDKKGIADYFASPMKVAMAGGSGSGDATSVLKGGGTDLTRVGGQVRNGDFEQQKKSMQQRALRSEQRRAEAARLASLQKKVEEKIEQNQKLAALKSQIKLEMTRDGLKIQIVDEQNRPMFDSGSALVKPYMRDLLREIGNILGEVPNRLTLEGHTDAEPFGSGERGYSNWELSSDRANASRRELIAGGLPEDRMLLVQGLASSVPLTPNDPKSPANRRIAIVVMNREAEDRLLGVTRPGDVDEKEHEAEAAPMTGAASAPPEATARADAGPRAGVTKEAPAPSIPNPATR